jgi:type VI protein secretion system component VasK
MVFTRLCRFVDWDLGRSGGVRTGSCSLLIAFMIAGLPALFVGHPVQGKDVIVLAAFGTIAALWIAFVLWRGWRLLRAEAVKADRAYDRGGKYQLPPEYVQTESATRAARRRANRQVRNDEIDGAR